MKVIFIDIDGVLNSTNGIGPYIADMEISKIELLKHIIDTTHSDGIVLMSDRRTSNVYMKEFLQAMYQYEINVIGQLRNPKDIFIDDNDNRGKQIIDYLANSEQDIEKIVILDDNDEGISDYFGDEFIKIDSVSGLNEEVANKIKAVLI